jgi:alanine racemase
VDRAAFQANLRDLLALLGGGPLLCAVLKADAYGHGLDLLLPTVIRMGVPAIGITDTAEAARARAAGFTGRLLRLRLAAPAEVAEGVAYGLEELAGDLPTAWALDQVAGERGCRIRYHLALNAGGMSRSGADLGREEGRRGVLDLLRLPHLEPAGLMTHFPVREREDGLRCLAAFERDAAWVMEHGRLDRRRLTLHCCNSFAATHVPEARLDMVRCGGLLYQPLDPFRRAAGEARPIAAFKSRVAAVYAYPAGNTVGYDRTCRLQRDSRLANVPAGYSDGVPYLRPGRGAVLIRGRRFPILGKVSMNTLMVDVTGDPEVRPGDEVVLFGRQGGAELSLGAFARAAGCACWESLLTTAGNLCPRVPVQEPVPCCPSPLPT